MKSSFKYLLIAVIFISSCTLGDKGSEKVPDSVKIDTTFRPSPAGSSQKSTDTSKNADSSKNTPQKH
ncbi:hypothetical protein [Pedobacter cryoconitis]|uniref:Uncharacterized protein n=1 Tax=Pedobacter cryoconitis TaxID=188932 RepID=A0A7X0J7L5_9SPHI|nr:hypothetical protein [Pedobacter cryoconitis]MBB6502305.1 hypothetical protein [Pedobacter cryoconitis]